LSTGAPPEPEANAPAGPTLFIDRDLWSRRLDAALREAGIPFVAHRELFANDTADVDWIAEVGRRGYTVLTRDQEIRRRPNELAAVRAARIHLFALTSGNLSAAEAAALCVAAWPAIQRAVLLHPVPALFSITRGGDVRWIKA
jgi:predicted nuclease of predicted toxin-antitoxin system